jgi:hypothetical protein
MVDRLRASLVALTVPASRLLRTVAAIALLVLPVAGCGDGQNAALLTLNAPPGVSNFAADRLQIELRQHSTQVSDTVQADLGGTTLTWPATVSFTFSSSVKGFIDFNVTAYSGGTEVATASGTGGPIESGKVTQLSATLQ